MKIYCYRYMWLFEDSENLQIKVLCGTEQEQENFMEQLKTAENVTKACRVYMHEIEAAKVEDYETIITKKDENEDIKEVNYIED